MKIFFFSALFIFAFSTKAQITGYVGTEAGPLVAISSSWQENPLSNILPHTTTRALRHYYGFVGGVLMQKKYSIEGAFYKQYMANKFHFGTPFFPVNARVHSPENDFKAGKVSLRLYIPIISGKKWEWQLMAGGANIWEFLGKINKITRTNDTLTWDNESVPITISQANQVYTWLLESGTRVTFKFNSHLSLGATLCYQSGFGTLKRSVGIYSGQNMIIAHTKGDAAMFGLSAQYNFLLKRAAKPVVLPALSN